MKGILIGCVIFVFAGVGMLVGGVYLALDAKQFLADAHEVQGVVVDRAASRPRIGERGPALSAPVVEYRDANGVAQIYQPTTRDSYSDFAVGKTVALVVRDATDGSPQSARLATTQDRLFASALLIFMGAGFSVFGMGHLSSLGCRPRVRRARDGA